MPISDRLYARRRQHFQSERDERFTRRIFALFVVVWLGVCVFVLALMLAS
jgi:hypothetical protein